MRRVRGRSRRPHRRPRCRPAGRASRYESFAPVSMHVAVGRPSNSRLVKGTPSTNRSCSSIPSRAVGGSSKKQAPRLRSTVKGLSPRTSPPRRPSSGVPTRSESSAGVETEQVRSEFVVPSGPDDLSRAREAHWRACVEEEPAACLGDEMPVHDLEGTERATTLSLLRCGGLRAFRRLAQLQRLRLTNTASDRDSPEDRPFAESVPIAALPRRAKL